MSSAEPGDIGDEASESRDRAKRGDNDDRSADLLLEVSVLFLVICSVDSESTHHSVVSSRDDETSAGAINAASSTKSHVLRLQVVVARLLVAKCDRFGLTSEDRLVHLEAVDGEHANVSGDAVTRVENDDVAGDELFGQDLDVLTIAHDGSALRNHGRDRVHDLVAAVVLDDRNTNVDENDNHQNDSESKISS